MYLPDNITKCLNQYLHHTHTLTHTERAARVFVKPFNYALAELKINTHTHTYTSPRRDNSIEKVLPTLRG